jgi:hypothetical protein
MERRDMLVIAGALVVVLILAVVVKPMLTGKEADLGIPRTPVPSTQPEVPYSGPVQEEPLEIVLTPVPTPNPQSGQPDTREKPGRDGGVSPQPLPSPTTVSWQPDPENPMPAVQMVEYADIVGRYTGNTAPFRIPTPYWEIAYNVTPSEKSPVFLLDVVEKGMKTGDDKTIRSMVYRPGKAVDPKEGRFFEGGQDYYLKITAENLEKYRIVISIPLKYIPDK